MSAIDAGWRAAHPLPVHGAGTDKNSRGRVLLVGGAEFVPGALRLTGEAVLRAGAGKVQMATVASAAMALGVLLPEAAMIALPGDADGEISAGAAEVLGEALAQCDTLVLGPGMSCRNRTATLLERLLAVPRPDLTLVLDAAGVSCAHRLAAMIAAHEGRIVLTPHHGEMAALTGLSTEEIADDPANAAGDAARHFNAIVVLKGSDTVIAMPDGARLDYGSDCVGLATGGSGDVLAGIVGGLLARGAAPREAAGWGVWLHGEAGRAAAARVGEIGFLARDLPGEIPRLMAAG